MTDDPNWIKEAGEAIKESTPVNKEEFEGELWLSTDGKNTVRVLSSTPEGRKAALEWAKRVYDAVKEWYGTKQAQAVREYGNNHETEASETFKCGTCGLPADYRSGVKNGRKWAGVFCSENKDHVKWVTVK